MKDAQPDQSMLVTRPLAELSQMLLALNILVDLHASSPDALDVFGVQRYAVSREIEQRMCNPQTEWLREMVKRETMQARDRVIVYASQAAREESNERV